MTSPLESFAGGLFPSFAGGFERSIRSAERRAAEERARQEREALRTQRAQDLEVRRQDERAARTQDMLLRRSRVETQRKEAESRIADRSRMRKRQEAELKLGVLGQQVRQLGQLQKQNRGPLGNVLDENLEASIKQRLGQAQQEMNRIAQLAGAGPVVQVEDLQRQAAESLAPEARAQMEAEAAKKTLESAGPAQP